MTTTAHRTETVTASMPVRVRAASPIHHGAGTSGNTAIIRTEDFITPEGQRTRTPMISGNSLRHGIRDALAWTLDEHLQIPDGALSKACVDLLWSAGALSQPGAQTDLDAMRTRHALLTNLGLMGYSHGPDIVSGPLRVSHAHLWCAENAWRLPGLTVQNSGPLYPAAEWIDEAFGTRHDVRGSSVDRLVNDALWGTTTTQMIYDFQVVRSGSVWAFRVDVNAAPRPQVDALVTAIARITRAGRWQVAAKAGTGYGDCLVEDMDLTLLDPDPDAAIARHIGNLTGHRDAVMQLLTSL